MKAYSFLFPLFILTFWFITGCVKVPVYPDKPEISFKSVSRPSITEGDTVTFTLSFTDGNGDIGPEPGTTPQDTNLFFCKQPFDSTNLFFSDPAFNVYFLDLRDSCWNHYASSFIQPTGKYDDLSGELDIIVGGFCKKFPPVAGQQDTLTYEIFIKDRSGMYSNRIRSTPVVIQCN